MDYIESGTRAFRHASLALFAGGFVTFSNLYTVQPLMPIFTKTYHISPAVASLSLSVSTATLAVFMLFSAVLSDAIGRKRIMSFSMFAASLIAIATAFAPSFRALIAMRLFLGVALAGVPAIAMAYIGEEFHKRSLGRAMGLYISGNSIGGLFGRLATGALTDWFNWRIALIALGALSLLFSLYFYYALPRPNHFRPKPTSFKETGRKFIGHLKHPGLVALFLCAFLLMGGFVTMFNYIGFLLTNPPYRVSQTLIGLIFLVYLTGTFSSTWMGKSADIIGAAPAIKRSLAIMFSGTVITLFSPVIVKIIGLAVFTFGFFGAHAVASGWVGERARANKAQASSLYLLFYYAGSSLIGAFGGFFWSGFGWIGVTALIASLILSAFILTYASQRLAEREV